MVNTYNILKIYKDIKKCCKSQDGKKLTSLAVKLKKEIESVTGQRINLDQALDQACYDLSSQGYKATKDQIKAVKKAISKKDKRETHKTSWFEHCSELGLEYDEVEEKAAFESVYGKRGKKTVWGDNIYSKEDPYDDMTFRVACGITLALCGIFLYVIPNPVCKEAGKWCFATALGFCIDGGINQGEDAKEREKEDRKKEKDKKKTTLVQRTQEG